MTKTKSYETEAFLEEYFGKSVRHLLRGRIVKMTPVEKGMPDRLVMLPGGILELVELKTLNGRRSAVQRLWHDRAYSGQNVRVTTLHGRDEIDAYIVSRRRRPSP